MPDTALIIDRLLADEPAFRSSLDFGPQVAQGTGAGPSLLIGDTSEISLMRPAQASYLDHRMGHLATSGDIVLVRRADPAFEAYLKEFRGLQDVTFLSADPARTDPVSRQAITTDRLRQAIVDSARQKGGLTVKSYLTTGSSWRLAQTIGRAAGCRVHVSGPAPRISKRANDKLWFARLARDIIGAEAIPPTMSAYGPAAACALILRFGKSGRQVIVKVPDSAGSAGNIRLDASVLAGQTRDSLKTILLDRLHATGWSDSYPVLVGVWDADVSCSPSVQLWIAQAGKGPPVAQGVFEQTVFGDRGAFVGAVRSTLPDTLQQELTTQAVKIATVLQQLGYYGTCSLDAVICKHGQDRPVIHWIECNGRWGGVSIPLAALDMITTGHPPEGCVILQQKIGNRTISTAQALAALQPVLLRQGQSAGAVLMSPPMGVHGTVANLLALADTQDAADGIVARAVDLLGSAVQGQSAATGPT